MVDYVKFEKQQADEEAFLGKGIRCVLSFAWSFISSVEGEKYGRHSYCCVCWQRFVYCYSSIIKSSLLKRFIRVFVVFVSERILHL